ncbi:MAG: 4-alpha-glucanotransferase [Oscillospiraceae bacterium]|nr:4-alpha-glucanotransferase [Oscillospiraceae bacterium]
MVTQLENFNINTRSAGILLPVFSLPSPYGIGTFGRAAYEWVDFLSTSGQRYWQVLPLGPTGYGDSPYQSFSAFAGNPYFIDLDLLCEQGLLKHSECASAFWGKDESKVDYHAVAAGRDSLLRRAFSRFEDIAALEEFAQTHAGWAIDYALFTAIKSRVNPASWQEWEQDIRVREPAATARLESQLEGEISYQLFVQYLFYRQWAALKDYANQNGVGIIGDIPIYVAMDSADTWGARELFLLGEDGCPTHIAGTPPDAFSSTGQLWGNPLYDWEALKATDYCWWVERMRASLSIYDVVRIDHFRGLESFYAIPAGSETALSGQWLKGPGMELIARLNSEFSPGRIIAEDLGLLTGEVRDLLKDSGYPGMSVLQFAFSPDEESSYLPHNHRRHSVCYTGTHDNDTTRGWFSRQNPADVKKAIEYLGAEGSYAGRLAFIRAALSSVANLAIVPIADYLSLGEQARINTPATLGEHNWSWRMQGSAATGKLAGEIARLTALYGREKNRNT